MRLFGIRASSATLGFGLLGSTLGILSAGSDGPGTPRYEVSATLLLLKDRPVMACWVTLQSLPPAGCSGVIVRGLDIGEVAGADSYPNGTVTAPLVHLAGTWDGHALTLTESPRPAASQTSLVEPCQQPLGTESSPTVPPRQLQVGNDQALLEGQGIAVLETVTCGDTLGIGVAVADTATVEYLQHRYGKVAVTGWLQPLPIGP